MNKWQSLKHSKLVFVCQQCGAQQPRWMGKCPDCGEWNSLVEEKAASAQPECFSARRFVSHARSHAARLSRHRKPGRCAPVFRHRRVRSRAWRRNRARLAGADRRRPGHRQINAAARGRRQTRRTSTAKCSTFRAKRASDRSSCAANDWASIRQGFTCCRKPVSNESSRRSTDSIRKRSSSIRCRRSSR